MVAIRPFRALRYAPQHIADLSQVIAPPYDVIDADEQERLYRASPYNLVRLTLGKQSPEDTPEENRYTRAQQDFDAWLEQGILSQDAAPSLSLIEHRFRDEGAAVRSRLGFLALLELGDAVHQTAYCHEATFAAPKEDRTKLLNAIPANLEPIFCVYPDEEGAVQATLRALTQRAEPSARAAINGEEVRVWPITDDAAIRDVARRLSASAVLIADGHHRFEVAYANRSRYAAVMTYFVSMADPSLIVRPIHRVTLRGASVDPRALEELCLIEEANELASLTQWLKEARGEGHFGYYDGRTLYRLRLKPEHLAHWLMAPTVPLPLATLDVSLLHGLVLPRVGVNGTGLHYTAEAASALHSVQDGQGTSAWLLRGIPLRQIYALAAAGLILPPKSTYFYPKVPSGLAINPHTSPT